MEISTISLLITGYFTVMLIVSYFSRKWLWKLICKSGGTTPEEVRKNSANLVQESMGGRNLQNIFELSLIRNAENPYKVSMLLKVYRLCLAPNIIFLIISFYNLANPKLIKVCIVGMIIVAVTDIVLIIAGLINSKNYSDSK